MFQGELVADLCEAIADFIAVNAKGAELTARKLGGVIRAQTNRERVREEERAEQRRATGRDW